VPITDAELVHQREPQFVRLLPVAIMNARYVSRIHLFDGSPEPASAAPVSPSAAEHAAEVAVPAAPAPSPPAPNLAAARIMPTRQPAVAAAAPAPQAPLPQPPVPIVPAVHAEDPVPFRMSDIEPVEGSVHRALSELAALHRDGLVTDAEFEGKRSEILSRL
jgi:hypothetical protein